MVVRRKPPITIVFLFFFLSASAFCQVKLPKLISDGMVLQRDATVRIWGWAPEGEKIAVHFIDSTYHATANNTGEWEVTLSQLKAGGPHSMQIDASNSITIRDIVIGDVWVCSGQSNMQLALGWLGNVYQDEIDHSENLFIRQFLVPMRFNFNGREKDFNSGTWQHAGPKNMNHFTAVGYFFARELYEAYKVPIGLINASLGGSSTEAWISEEAIKSFPKYFEEAQRFKDSGLLERIKKQDDERVGNWNKLVRQNDEGYRNHQQTWHDPELDTKDWDTVHVPGYWADTKLGPVNGVIWFSRKINVPSSMMGREVATLVDEVLAAGNYYRHWDVSKMSSGVYFCRLTTNAGNCRTKKMLLLK